MSAARQILDATENTRFVQLEKLAPRGHPWLVAKLKSANPTGSMKDRMALAIIEAAQTEGGLKPGGHVVEFAGGSTGTSSTNLFN
jgi:cysteine synthase A